MIIPKARGQAIALVVSTALVRFSQLTVFATIIGTVMLVALTAPAIGFSWADTGKILAYMFLLSLVSAAAGGLVPTLATRRASTFRDWYSVTLAMALAMALTDNPALSWAAFLDSLVINFPLPLIVTGLSVLTFGGFQALRRTGHGNTPCRTNT